ncbi:MAG: hypothetical protein FE048_03895 [Thermoplasmata archaeon]|nr:MAG: hypothetical protein FE048_03895 [Thermoplasmata archaeon]
MGKNNDEKLRKEIKELSRKIEELEKIIHHLREPFAQMHEFADRYIRLIDSFARLGILSPGDIFSDVKDDISKEIIGVLISRNNLNISQITEAVRQRRGSASRRIIRERLQYLEKLGKVQRMDDKKGVVYSLSEDVIKKWSQMLGLFK